jgi:hypothetical protein
MLFVENEKSCFIVDGLEDEEMAEEDKEKKKKEEERGKDEKSNTAGIQKRGGKKKKKKSNAAGIREREGEEEKKKRKSGRIGDEIYEDRDDWLLLVLDCLKVLALLLRHRDWENYGSFGNNQGQKQVQQQDFISRDVISRTLNSVDGVFERYHGRVMSNTRAEGKGKGKRKGEEKGKGEEKEKGDGMSYEMGDRKGGDNYGTSLLQGSLSAHAPLLSSSVFSLFLSTPEDNVFLKKSSSRFRLVSEIMQFCQWCSFCLFLMRGRWKGKGSEQSSITSSVVSGSTSPASPSLLSAEFPLTLFIM